MDACVFCKEEFESRDLVSQHVYQQHPEKMLTADQMQKAMTSAMNSGIRVQIAVQLTGVTLGNGKNDIEDVLNTFKEVYSRIGEWV